MLKINLRDLYPYKLKPLVIGDKLIYVKVPNPSCVVEVYAEDRQSFVSTMTEETADIYFDFRRKKIAYLRRMFRYGANFTLDAGDGIERHALIPAPTPHGVFFDKLKRCQLHVALDALPEKQRRRVKAHFYGGMSYLSIAKTEKVHESSVRESIDSGLRKMEKYFT